MLIESLVMFLPGLLGLLIPYVTETVTGADIDPRIKSVINIALSLLAGVLPTIALVGGAAGVMPYLINVATAWLLSGRLYVSKLVPGVDLENSTTVRTHSVK